MILELAWDFRFVMEFFKQTEDSCFLKNRNLVGILSFNFQFKFRQNGALLGLEKDGLDIKHLPQKLFLLSEVNDFKRFNAAGVFMSFLGLVPRKLPKENKLVLQKREARGFGEL